MSDYLNKIESRLVRLEAAREVSATLHQYMQLCDYLDEGTDLEPLFEAYTLPPAHFVLNVHFLTSECVDVQADDEAQGRWVLLQTSTYTDGRSQLSCALLEVNFRREEGRWKIAHFQTTSRFNRPVETPWDNPKALPVPEDNTK